MPIPIYIASLLMLLINGAKSKTSGRNQLIDSGMPPFDGPLT
jgi:hypothetical protein